MNSFQSRLIQKEWRLSSMIWLALIVAALTSATLFIVTDALKQVEVTELGLLSCTEFLNDLDALEVL